MKTEVKLNYFNSRLSCEAPGIYAIWQRTRHIPDSNERWKTNKKQITQHCMRAAQKNRLKES